MPRKTATSGLGRVGVISPARSDLHRLRTWIFPALILAIALLSKPVAAGRFTLETNNFFIHFDGDLETLAQHVAVVAEEVHHELVPRVDHTPTDKTHLVLLDETDMANGFADPILYPKITVFPVSPTFFSPYGSGISPRMTEWLRLVILHEYAHVLQLDMNDGIGKSIERLFGRVPLITNPMVLQGPAFVEGFATYHETVAELGGRGEDPFYRMFLRTMVLEEEILHLDQILGHYPLERWKPGAAAYLYGYSLWEFMADTYGEATLRRFNEVFARTASLKTTFDEALGTTPESFYKAWQNHLRARFADELESLRARGTTPTQPLGGQGYVPESPAASPDGRALAYATINGPVASALRLIQWEDGEIGDRQLVPGIVVGPIAWSPDGGQLYYAKVLAEGLRTWSDLYRYDLATGREQRLTRRLRAIGPAPSPDGRRLVFTSRDGLATRLLELDLDLVDSLPVEAGSSAVREILPAAGDAQRLAAGWFPDGHSILVSSHESGGGMDLLRLDPASGELAPLVVGSGARGGAGMVNGNAQFTPDGRFILFESDRTGLYNLYAYEPATGETFMVARTLTGLFDPTLILTEAGPRLVAMEYTARGYRLSLLPYEPGQWERASGSSGFRSDAPIVRIVPVDAPTIRISPP